MTKSRFFTSVALVVMASAILAPARADDKIEIEGKYKCKGYDIDGKEYTGMVEIKKRGEIYKLKWTLDGPFNYEGVGLITDNHLSVSWLNGLNAGVIVYRVEKGPKLTGRWAQLGAKPTVQKEVLTLEK